MCSRESATLENIKSAGIKEFLDKGFEAASLRSIAKDAGVTTGAFYGYFSSKQALFAALVEKHAAAVMGSFMKAQEDFSALPKESQADNMCSTSIKCINEIIDYAYEHYDCFKLLICCSGGTTYENFIHNMVEIEVESTLKFIEVLKQTGHNVPEIDAQLCHIISSGLFNAIFEMIVHDMPKAKAKQYINRLCEFNKAGWEKIMGL